MKRSNSNEQKSNKIVKNSICYRNLRQIGPELPAKQFIHLPPHQFRAIPPKLHDHMTAKNAAIADFRRFAQITGPLRPLLLAAGLVNPSRKS